MYGGFKKHFDADSIIKSNMLNVSMQGTQEIKIEPN
jgi:hypothetical protein